MVSKTKRRQNSHHLFWPRRAYNQALWREFRELPCLKVSVDVEVHALLHRMYEPPRMPDEATMEYFLDRHRARACACFEGEKIQSNILEY